MDLGPVVGRVLDGERISPREALALHEQADLATLAYLADEVRRRKHPEPVVTYIIDRNLNPTNVCVTDCGFCAFYAKPKDEAKGYVLDRETIYAKIQETVDVGGVQILMQGGHHPQLGVEWFEELLLDIKARWPRLHMHCMSPPEIEHLAKVSKLSTLEVLRRLQAAGMDSLPGGGAEILVESVRERIAPRKTDTETWLRIMEEAHSLGMRTTATMMFGHVETVADRIEHLDRLRQVQDRLHRLDLPARRQPAGRGAAGRRLAQGHPRRVFPHHRGGAHLPRQLRQPASQFRDPRPRRRAVEPAHGLQRLRLGDARGERGLLGRLPRTGRRGRD